MSRADGGSSTPSRTTRPTRRTRWRRSAAATRASPVPLAALERLALCKPPSSVSAFVQRGRQQSRRCDATPVGRQPADVTSSRRAMSRTPATARQGGVETMYVFADVELDLDRYEIRRHGSAVPVEPQVFDVLAYLAANGDRVVSKEEL